MSYFEKNIDNITIDGEITVMIRSLHNGLQWRYKNQYGDELSVILHTGSYGGGQGLFEIMPSWRPPTVGDSVKGNVTFGEVQKWINELKRIKKHSKKRKTHG